MRFSLPSLAALFLAAFPIRSAYSTTIIALRTDEEAYVAADSKIAAVDGSQPTHGCKLKVIGDVVFASAGLLKETKGPYDIQETARQAIEAGGTLEEIVTRFKAEVFHVYPAVLQHLRQADIQAYSTLLWKRAIIQTVFVHAQSGVIHMASLSFQPSDASAAATIKTTSVECPGPTCPGALMVGVLGENSAVVQRLDREPTIWRDEQIVPALNHLIDLQALATPDFVSPPVAIISVAKGGQVSWIEPGLCH